jgi:hypothetical protein
VSQHFEDANALALLETIFRRPVGVAMLPVDKMAQVVRGEVLQAMLQRPDLAAGHHDVAVYAPHRIAAVATKKSG